MVATGDDGAPWWRRTWLLARRTNCLLWGVRLYLRLHAHRVRTGARGYLSFRRSDLAKMSPHIVYTELTRSGRVRMVSYVPVEPVRRILPPAIFRGRVRWGDGHDG